jgi:NAD(P)-dependent dehydrogenase (short-subunit alcohol dehydrogenase family)
VWEDLQGRTAVVTGGARGLGLSLATALAGAGVAVGLLDLLPQVTQSAASLTAEHGVEALGLVVDVTDPAEVDTAFETVTGRLGTPSVLITSAGTTIWGDSVDVDPQAWRQVIDINLNGTFYACQSFARRALDAGGGSIVCISSMSAQIVNLPQHQASYHASKAAVGMLVKALGVEWAERGVRVNAIAPGYFLSDMTRQFTQANPDLAQLWRDSIPMKRMGEPEDLHGLALFLASSASSYLTAQTVVIDGGYTAL